MLNKSDETLYPTDVKIAEEFLVDRLGINPSQKNIGLFLKYLSKFEQAVATPLSNQSIGGDYA